MLRRLLAALEERTGLGAAWTAAGRRDVPVAAIPGRAVAVALGALLLLELVTGVALSFTYAPSATDAWASVWYLDARVPLGRLLRGVHGWGMSAILVVLGLHLAEVVLRRAYRAPRELTWIAGVLLLQLVLAFAVTGNPLPWDQRGYWASQVETAIVRGVPAVGPALRDVLVGGNEYGNLTVTRLFALHALVLPLGLVLLAAGHAALALRHGAAAPATGPGRSGAGRSLPVHSLPRLAGIVASLLAIGVVIALAAARPAVLDAPADPSSTYLARPEWYFVPLNQLLTYFPGGLQLVGSAVLPGLALAFLLALPWLDRGTGPGRLAAIGGTGLVGAVAAVLLGLGLSHEANDPAVAHAHAGAERAAERARRIAADGIPPAGALAMVQSDPVFSGEKVFGRRCGGCHPVGGQGTDEPKGPDLAGYLSSRWLTAVLRHPEEPRFFGVTKLRGMEDYADRDPADLAMVVELLRRVREHPGRAPDELPAEVSKGLALYEELGCEACHPLAPGEAGSAPNLAGYGSDEWLRAFLQEPGGPLFYGDENDMPSFAKKLSPAEQGHVIAYVRTLEELPLALPAVAGRGAR